MGNSIRITGSTIGAIAIGDGAVASSGEGDSGFEVYDFKFDAAGATREQIATWLRRAADIVADPDHPTKQHSANTGNASRAWSLIPRGRR